MYHYLERIQPEHLHAIAAHTADGEIAGRAAEHVGDDDNAAAAIDGLHRVANLRLLLGEIVLRIDRNGDGCGLSAHDMFGRREQLPRQPANHRLVPGVRPSQTAA